MWQADWSLHNGHPHAIALWIAIGDGSPRLVPNQANRSSLSVAKRLECFGSPHAHVPCFWFEPVVPVIAIFPLLLFLEEQVWQKASEYLQKAEAGSPSQ